MSILHTPWSTMDIHALDHVVLRYLGANTHVASYLKKPNQYNKKLLYYYLKNTHPKDNTHRTASIDCLCGSIYLGERVFIAYEALKQYAITRQSTNQEVSAIDAAGNSDDYAIFKGDIELLFKQLCLPPQDVNDPLKGFTQPYVQKDVKELFGSPPTYTSEHNLRSKLHSLSTIKSNNVQDTDLQHINSLFKKDDIFLAGLKVEKDKRTLSWEDSTQSRPEYMAFEDSQHEFKRNVLVICFEAIETVIEHASDKQLGAVQELKMLLKHYCVRLLENQGLDNDWRYDAKQNIHDAILDLSTQIFGSVFKNLPPLKTQTGPDP